MPRKIIVVRGKPCWKRRAAREAVVRFLRRQLHPHRRHPRPLCRRVVHLPRRAERQAGRWPQFIIGARLTLEAHAATFRVSADVAALRALAEGRGALSSQAGIGTAMPARVPGARGAVAGHGGQ